MWPPRTAHLTAVSCNYWFQLLKILQQFGEIEKFDMLFHRSGPLYGQPRGYAFVTYKRASDAVKALTKLDGQRIGIKYCSIRYAKNVNYDDMGDRQKPRIEIPALCGTKDSGPLAGGSSSSGRGGGTGDRRKDSAIQAIEAKLRMLEGRTAGDEFKVNRTVTQGREAPISKYQFNLNNETDRGFGKYPHHKRNQRNHRPYNNRATSSRGGGHTRR